MQDWYLLVQEDGRWFRTGNRWCRTGSCWYLLVQEGDRWCRKAVAGSGLVVAGAELVIAAAGRSPV